MRRNIICDTMIWYYLGNGLLDFSELSNDNLLATYINIYELANTPRIYDDFSYYQNALLGLNKYHSSIIKETPVHYLVNCGKVKHRFDDTDLFNMLSAFNQLLAQPNDLDINNIDISTYKQNAETIKLKNTQMSEDWNQLLPVVRNNIKKLSGKKKHRLVDSSCYIKLIIKEIVRKEYFVDWNYFDWNRINYFVKVWDLYFKELELCQTGKIKGNDWLDIYNFLYVNPDYYYLTCEKKWNNLVQNDVVLKERMIFKEINAR